MVTGRLYRQGMVDVFRLAIPPPTYLQSLKEKVRCDTSCGRAS